MNADNYRIALINPPLTMEEQAGSLEEVANLIPPLGLCCVAAVLREAGFPVGIIDAPVRRLTPEAVVAELAARPPALVGLGATILSIANAFETARAIKRAFPKLPVVLGGPHLTAIPNEVLAECPEIEYGVIGEGEATMVELARGLAAGDLDPAAVRGLAWRRASGELVINPRREYIADLDALPIPARDLLPPLATYTPNPAGYKRLPFAHVVGSRGCPFRCVFCDRSVFGRKYRTRSAAKIADELEALATRFGVREIKYYDDLFTVTEARVFGICDEIIRRKLDLTWSCSSRVDTVTPAMLARMKAAGCWQIDFGIESGSQRILDAMRKDITLDAVRRGVRLTREAGISTRAFFVLGMPGETLDTIDETVKLAIELDLDIATFYTVQVFPGNELYQMVRREGTLLHRDYRQYTSVIDFERTRLHYLPAGFTEATFKSAVKRAYRRFYFRPRYLWKRLRSIDSWLEIRKYWIGLKTLVSL